MSDLLRAYDCSLKPLRFDPITIVEFCQNSDESLRSLRDYFPNARIVGVFGSDRFRSFESDRIAIQIGSQSDRSFMRHIGDSQRPHIVIDNGSHFWSEQLLCLEMMFPAIMPDGFYIVEALHTSFDEGLKPLYGINNAANTFDVLLRFAKAVVGHSAIDDYPDLALCTKFASEVSFFEKLCLIRRTKSNPLVRTILAKVAADETVDLNNGGAYRRSPALILDTPDWLRQVWTAIASEELADPPPAQVHRLANVTIHGRGVIEAASGDLIEESLINTFSSTRVGPMTRMGQDRRLFFTHNVEIAETIADADCVLLKQTWDDNYGHWIIESLPRVALIEDFRSLETCRFIIGYSSESMNQVYRDSLAAFGIRPDQILFTSDYSYNVKELLYPAPITIQPWIKAPRAIRTAERVGRAVIEDPNTGPRLLYVSRNKIGKRHLQNEKAIVDILSKRGFVTVYPETMSFSKQVQAFSNAAIVVGTLGGALTNVVFSPTGVTMFALTTQFMQDDFFWDLVGHKSGRYISLHGTALNPELGMQSDFSIDIGKFLEVLDDIFQSSTMTL